MAQDQRQRQSPWPDLVPELLLLILHRLATVADRFRAGAVCRPWRCAVSMLPPTGRLPCVVFGDGTLFDLAKANDSEPYPHHRLRLPDDCFCYSAGENMMFLVHQRDGSCSLLNAVSGARTHLPELADLLRPFNLRHKKGNEFRGYPNYAEASLRAIGKVVASSVSDHDPIVAVLVEHLVFVSTCRQAGESNLCLIGALRNDATDIALFQGRIYALSGHVLETLELELDLELDNGHQPYELNKNIELINHPWEHHHEDYIDPLVEMYLVETAGKLVMVKRCLCRMYMRCVADGRRTYRLELWEADLSQRRWKKMDGSLDGRALFVSRPCSKSLPAGYGVRGDCIYFLNRLYQWKQPEVPLGDSGVYNIRDKAFTPLVRDSTLSLPWKSEEFPSWFFPDQV